MKMKVMHYSLLSQRPPVQSTGFILDGGACPLKLEIGKEMLNEER
jgi:hypothetical protein